MTQLRALALLAVSAIVVLSALARSGPVAAATAVSLSDTVTVTIEPPTGAVDLGQSLDLTVTVSNSGAADSPPLIVHLDITDPDRSTSVDPEDWTPTLSRTVGVVGPGETVVVDWTIQPISAGTFATYAVALASGVESIASSNVLFVSVADQRSLNPGGILPVAIAAPTAIGGLLLVQLGMARRTTRSTPRPFPEENNVAT